MSGYLKRFISEKPKKGEKETEEEKKERLKGKYRVRADYDLSTNDFIRDENGNLDSSFDDYYIKIKSGKIRHYQGKELLVYIQSITRFRNILKRVYQEKIGDIEKFKISKTKYDLDKMYEELISNGIITYVDEMEGEGEFHFHVKDMEYFANILEAETLSSHRSPFSVKNLPKENLKSYVIPLEDLALYEEIIKSIPKNEILKVVHINKRFNDVIVEKKGKKYDIKAEQKLAMLKGKEFYHSINMWKEYIDFLRKSLNMENI